MNKFVFILTIFLLIECKNGDIGINNIDRDTPNNLFVYQNNGTVVYLVDYETYEVVKPIILGSLDTIDLFGITISTNRDYLVFSGVLRNSNEEHIILSYHIKDSITQIFTTGLDSVGAPRMAPALDSSNPGLIYFYSHTHGLYSIDFLEKKVVQLNSEKRFGVEFYNSPNASYSVILKNYSNPTSYSEIEFYQQGSSLQNLLFVFNDNDEYDMSVYDVDFSDNDEFMYVSYQLSDGRSREIESYFGTFDLVNKQLIKSEIRFPWSLNPYYIEYSPKRKEAYLVGKYDQFYIVNTENNTLADSVTITGKVDGPSRILTDPDEDVAFVSCSRSDKIVVIDLDRRQVIEDIQITSPYKMIIPWR